MNQATLLAALLVALLTACKDDSEDDSNSIFDTADCNQWCPDFDGDGRGEYSTRCDEYCFADGVYPPNNGCNGVQYVQNCDEVRQPPFSE